MRQFTKQTGMRASALFLVLAMLISLAACGNSSGSSGTGSSSTSQSQQGSGTSGSSSQPEGGGSASSGSSSGQSSSTPGSSSASGSRILIAFFSHTGENHNVGVIEKGNTHIIADMIAEETGADMFEIQTVEPYPETYDECTDVAKQEQNDNARPEIVDPPENLDGYDTIFLGYPIWWGDLPMAVYTFLEGLDFSGRTVIPFCTHEGSGLSGTENSIKDTCQGAEVLDGLAIRGSTAQNEQEEARASVLEWLGGLGIDY